ncbi:hypothetical protein RUM44_005462 [Polyplax serrata]|uniref:FAM192A/Fyv6 N-terminal domain-containing protein n=1 Tax=Polyplax serrata TaxID=468196 RepID=A0ABR1AWI8_POLSC
MSSGFISESELAEKRRIRQEEWEKVRQPNQPMEAPEEVYDRRSLFERLEEQKQKKQLEYEEAHRLKNMIKGLDDDEIEFLDMVDKKKLEAEQLKDFEEQQELLDFRAQVEKLKKTNMDQKRLSEINISKCNNYNSSAIKSQGKLLKGIIKKKASNEETKRLTEDSKHNDDFGNEYPQRKRKFVQENEQNGNSKCQILQSGLTCVGILPGLGSYVETSDDSDHSSSASEGNDDKKYDLAGRRIVYKSKQDPE